MTITDVTDENKCCCSCKHNKRTRYDDNVSEVICVKCGKRWISVRPKDTLLKDIVCMNCGCGYVIETGEEMKEVTE